MCCQTECHGNYISTGFDLYRFGHAVIAAVRLERRHLRNLTRSSPDMVVSEGSCFGFYGRIVRPGIPTAMVPHSNRGVVETRSSSVKQ